MSNVVTDLLTKTENGFKTLNVGSKYKKSAIENLGKWLTEHEYEDYKPQIIHLINNADWDYLLDCFYQIIPFGTGGRRGEVGIGPNRINTWTIQASAQGHSQYLIKESGDSAKQKGVVLTFGVREFFGNKHFNKDIPNPVVNLTGKKLAISAAEVYTANQIKTFIFREARTTPQLSFTIRYKGAIAGDMFDASHNPPEHNGKKVYDQFGGQLIPPFDENLVTEVTKNVVEIKKLDLSKAEELGLLEYLGEAEDEAYFAELLKLSLSEKRSAIIVYTPLHGVGSTSCLKLLEKSGFKILSDPKTSNQSGRFENVTFNIPNPEVIQSFDTTLEYAKTQADADLILNSDPDADRIGVMVKHKNEWVYLNGNEIGAVLVRFAAEKYRLKHEKGGVIVKTTVTTNLASEIAKANKMELIGELPVGFKYIGDEMNKLESNGRIEEFIMGLEESHGYIAGNYLRDKDAAIGALWLAELASELKTNGKTIIDYLEETYTKYGYFLNYLTEIRLPGAEGMEQIRKIQDSIRIEKPKNFGKYEIESIEDFLDRTPIVSDTDRGAKDLLVFHFKPFANYVNLRITLRPSGTEPKAKMYFELGNKPSADSLELANVKVESNNNLRELEKLFMLHCYKILGIDFPVRGFLLFWQIPMKDKLRYFEIEAEIEKLKGIEDTETRKNKLSELLGFLGSDPVQKVDAAFKDKYKIGIQEYLGL